MIAEKTGLIGRACKVAAVAGVLLIATFSTSANALTFKPSEIEWLTWPEYCRVRYVVSGAGVNSSFSNRISRGQIEATRRQIGADAWHWLHHYCAGIVFFERSKAATSVRERDYLIRSAKGQIRGQYTRVPRNDPFFPEVATALGKIHRHTGEYEAAIKFVNESISAAPTFSSAYALASLIYKDLGDLENARSILEQGNVACEEKSAEIHYFLGLLYIDSDQLELASEHAAKAYDLGYPLPGLRAKLADLGHSAEN